MATCSRRPARTTPVHKTSRTTVLLIAAVAALVAAARHFGSPTQGIDWEKRFERMPDNAPPKWMFTNIKTIRQNTDRILELLEQPKGPTSQPTGT